MLYEINLMDETVKSIGEAIASPIDELQKKILDNEDLIQEQSETIAQQEEQIDALEGQVGELEQTVDEQQAIIDAFPTIEALSVTENGTYSVEGKAYSPVNVNVVGGYEELQLLVVVTNNTGDMLHIPCSYFYKDTYDVVTVTNIFNTPNGGVANTSFVLPKSNDKPSVRLQLHLGAGHSVNVTQGATGVSVSPQATFIDIGINIGSYVNNSRIYITIS